MGLLSKIIETGAKGADISKAARSIPKREMNPLIKRRGEELRKKIEEENTVSPESSPYTSDDATIGKMYSPLISTAEQMDIGAGGTKGENIEAFLRKRAPNVTEAEKQFYELGFEPQTKYTRDEVLDILKNRNTEYTIRKKVRDEDYDDLNWEDQQRQPIFADEKTYEEIIVDADRGSIPLGEHVTHYSPETVVHTRLSVISPYDEPDYKAVLVEEIQSDLYKIAELSDLEMKSIMKKQYTPFTGFVDELRPVSVGEYEKMDVPALEWHKANIEDFTQEFELKVGNEKALAVVLNAYKKIEDLETSTTVRRDIEEGKRIIKEETRLGLKDNGIIVSGRDINQLIERAYRYILEVDDTYLEPHELNMADDSLERGFVDDFYDSVDSVVPQIMANYNDLLKDNLDINKGYKGYTPDTDPRKPVPVKTKTDVVRKGILANIAYAKENGIDKILVPSYKEIAAQRVSTFDDIAHRIKDQKTAEKYFKLLTTDAEAADKIATEYFERVFKPFYDDALRKVLRTLSRETKGQIKIGTKTMPYKNVLENKKEMKTLIEIDISNFEFDPKNDALRFNRGGLVA